MLLQGLCIISEPLVNSKWSYSPETTNLGQIRRFLELDDEQVAAKLSRIIKSSNQEILDSVTSLSAQVLSLKEALAQRDAVINDLRAVMSELRHQNDALEQHGRRNSLRISGISEE